MQVSTSASEFHRPGSAAPTASAAPASATAAAVGGAVAGGGDSPAVDDSTSVRLSAAGRSAASAAVPGALDPAELEQLARLKARDRQVRAHEQAHQAVAGTLAAGGASYSYQRGPDGVNYAIGGEVPISLRQGRTPEETIANAQTIRAAALAPADPSPQDRAIAAAATQMEADARAELAAKARAARRTDQPDAATSPGAVPRSEAGEARIRAVLADQYGLRGSTNTGFKASA